MAEKQERCRFRHVEFVNPGEPKPRTKSTFCNLPLEKGRCPVHGDNVTSPETD